jgi:hypothetical protein
MVALRNRAGLLKVDAEDQQDREPADAVESRDLGFNLRYRHAFRQRASAKTYHSHLHSGL